MPPGPDARTSPSPPGPAATGPDATPPATTPAADVTPLELALTDATSSASSLADGPAPAPTSPARADATSSASSLADGPAPARTSPSPARVWLALLVLAAGYAALRLAMNREFAGAPWDELLAFTAAKPFGLRVLVPLLAWPLHTLLRVPTTWVFGLFETLATVALVLATAAALRPFVPRRHAAALAVLLVLLLPIAFLLQHRWPIFYPYDTPAIAFVVAGVALLLRGRWRATAVLTFVAALNRESAALVPLAALALHIKPVPGDMSFPTLPMRQLLARVLGLFAAAGAARLLVGVALRDNPGAPLQFMVDGAPRLLANLAWLEEPAHWLRLPAYFGFVPLAWALLRPWLPARLRRLGWVALAYLFGLLWVANIDEPRVYGEALALLYLPVAVALVRWLRADPPPV